MALVMTFALAQRAQADSILYRSDMALGTDQMAAALADPSITGIHSVTIATSEADFATKLGSGLFELGIFAQQNSSGSSYDAAWSAMATHIAGGGAAIGINWKRDSANVAGMDASFTGGTNQASVTITDAGLAAGLTNPVLLINPGTGWGTFSTGLTPLAGGTTAATFGNGDGAIIIGNGGRTIMNGMLNDTFDTGADGKRLFINEIRSVLGSDAPEPGSLALIGLGIAGLATFRRRKRRVS